MGTLQFYHIQNLVEPECIEQTFSLEGLIIRYRPFNYENLRNFVKLNPQVKRLSLIYDTDVHITGDLMQFIDQKLLHLEELILLISGEFTIDNQPLVLKNVKILQIYDYSMNRFRLSYLSNEKVEAYSFA